MTERQGRCFNQDGVVVCSFTRTLLVYKRDHAPRPPVPRPAEDSLPPVRE